MRSFASILHILFVGICSSNNSDRFNYRETEGTDYGPSDWDEVSCSDPGECLGWPDGWELGVGWELNRNRCKWCPATENNCGLHRQSPIDLLRARSQTGHDNECYDYHWMAYEDGSCRWHDMIKNGYTNPKTNFRIQRHALQILTPVDENGELQCNGKDGKQFPRLDYSKGFPDWWFLSHTEVTVPSEHTQEGKRFGAEVHLSHFYSVNHERKVGKVAIFLDDSSTRRWPFLDKLICQWREVEEQTRQDCGLESAPPYPGCRNPSRAEGETYEEDTDPYPFIDCDTIENYSRICKKTSCCEEERSTTNYCQNDVYGRYGDEVVGSICWWCCPGKVLATNEHSPITAPTSPAPIYTMIPSTTPFRCSDYDGQPGIDLDRICKDDSCCDPDRSATDHCHYVYKFFGEKMEQVCSECCNPAKDVGPSPEIHPIYPLIDCTFIDNPFRMCKPASCCDQVRSESEYCKDVYKTYGDLMGSVCWYCCSEPKEVDPSVLSYDVTWRPTSRPTGLASTAPTSAPSNVHSVYPSGHPSFGPTGKPSTSPSTLTGRASSFPSGVDSSSPTSQSFPSSSSIPSLVPTSLPSVNNTTRPSEVPSNLQKPSSRPEYIGDPSSPPTLDPSQLPSAIDSAGPTLSPSMRPTSKASDKISDFPSIVPSLQPSDIPFQCDDYDKKDGIEFRRICKNDGCCDPVRSATSHCHYVYKFFGENMEKVCSECCRPSKEVAPAPPAHPIYPPIDCTLVSNPFRICKPTSCCNKERSETWYCNNIYETYGDAIGSICWYCCSNPKEIDETVLRYLAGPEEHKKQEGGPRKLAVNGDNYANVRFSPYEWMREVKTEYYFRYEGGQMVPPCFETVHYRILKDPLRIHPDQLAELERLLAWRIAPKGSKFDECQRDSAGRERQGTNGNAVDLNRPLQRYSNIHRKVFCECNDWISKWKEDREWCKLDRLTRFYERPYNYL